MVSLCADVCTEKTSQHIPIYLSTCIVEHVNVITSKGFKLGCLIRCLWFYFTNVIHGFI